MKFLLRNTVIYAFTLFLLPQILPGIKIEGDFLVLLISGFILTVMFLILKPIVNIISIPLNIMTLGLFSALVNVLILYLLTVFVPNISIVPFQFSGVSFAGFSIPAWHLGLFFAYFAIGIVLALISGFLRWIVR